MDDFIHMGILNISEYTFQNKSLYSGCIKSLRNRPIYSIRALPYRPVGLKTYPCTKCKHCLKYAQHCLILSRGVGAAYSQRGCVFLPVSRALQGGRAEPSRAEPSVFACSGTSLYRLKSVSLTPPAPQRQRLCGEHGRSS